MSKNSLYLIIAIALAATAATFFISRRDVQHICFVNSVVDEGVVQTPASEKGLPAYVSVRGFPLQYYQEPFPADCIAYNSAPSSMFNTAHLAYDLLIWAAVALLLFMPSALFKWWRGPRMLGDRR